MLDERALRSALRSIPAIVTGDLAGGATSFVAHGTLAREPAPGALTWEIGSITKVFTGVLLADMVIRTEVDLDDPISRWVPEQVAARLPASPPTLRHLATHTSGLPGLPRTWLRRLKESDNPYAALTEEDVWAVLGPTTRCPTRPRVRYSNYGMGLLGHLLARAGGTDYPTLVRQRILEPLGLSATGFEDRQPVPGYRRRRLTPAWTFGALHAAGALRSTAGDLLEFARAVIDPPRGPLGDAIGMSLAPVHRGRVTATGLGWQHRMAPARGNRSHVVWHNGGTYATQSFLGLDIDRGHAVVVFGNRGPVLRMPATALGMRALDGR